MKERREKKGLKDKGRKKRRSESKRKIKRKGKRGMENERLNDIRKREKGEGRINERGGIT